MSAQNPARAFRRGMRAGIIGPIAALSSALLLVACVMPSARQGSQEDVAARRDTALVLFGTRDPGPGSGIAGARLDLRTGALEPLGMVGEVHRPTWLTTDENTNMVYAATDSEEAGGEIVTLRADEWDVLTVVARSPSGGRDPTQIALDREAHRLFVANYASGTGASLPLGADRSAMTPVSIRANSGSGPHRRQDASHAHGVTLDPTGRFLLVADFGADRVHIYRVNDRGELEASRHSPVILPPGFGPRHMVFHPNGRFVYQVAELASEVRIYRWDAAEGALETIDTTSLVFADEAADRSASELAITADGRFLYVLNRAEHAIVVFSVDDKTGLLSEVQRLPSSGRSPWHLALSPGNAWLLVANLASNSVVVFGRDRTTGRLEPTSNAMVVEQAAVIAFLRD